MIYLFWVAMVCMIGFGWLALGMAVAVGHHLLKRVLNRTPAAPDPVLVRDGDPQTLAFPSWIPQQRFTSIYITEDCGCSYLGGELAYRCVDCSDITEVIDTELDGWVSFWADQQRKEGR